MNVSKEAREAAWEHKPSCYSVDNYTDWMAGKYDLAAPIIRTMQRVRDEALEEAAVKAISIGEQYGEDETGWLDCSETIATAIRQMIGGKA